MTKSRYTKLTTTTGLQIDDIIYTDTHGGKTPCRVVEIQHDNNTVFAPYQSVWDNNKTRSEFDHCGPVAYYYAKTV